MPSETDHFIVPATPGWFVAIYVSGGKDYEEYLMLEPIIAWEIEREVGPYQPSMGRPGEQWLSRNVMPITVERNLERQGNPWAIKRPDGTYTIPGDADFKDDADLIAELHERYQQDERRRPQKRQPAGA
jgi:hypothetical protein